VCRHLAYLGPPVSLAALVLDPPHSLAHQSWAPRDMRGGGTISADGFGIGWYADGTIQRYRRDRPIWADPFLPELLRASTPAVLAAVRGASPGMPRVETACAPFMERAGEVAGGWLFSLNGRVTGWPDSVAGLAGRLPTTDLLTMDAPVDSALVWALVRWRMRSGVPPPEAVATTVADVLAAAPDSRLNLLLTDSRTILATTVTHSLWARHDGRSVTVCSEPLDEDPAWRPVPEGVLLVATPTDMETFPLPEKGDPS
jgi:glutamine amidotransferase